MDCGSHRVLTDMKEHKIKEEVPPTEQETFFVASLFFPLFKLN